jgi:hypothetical protein
MSYIHAISYISYILPFFVAREVTVNDQQFVTSRLLANLGHRTWRGVICLMGPQVCQSARTGPNSFSIFSGVCCYEAVAIGHVEIMEIPKSGVRNERFSLLRIGCWCGMQQFKAIDYHPLVGLLIHAILALISGELVSFIQFCSMQV